MPQSGAADEHYQELGSWVDLRCAFSPRLLLGDFNARIIKTLPHESTSFGHYTHGASWADLDSLSPAQLENRTKFVEFSLEKTFVAKNRFLQKPPEPLITYKAVGVKTWQTPWTLHKYAQMDYLLVDDRWKNSITDTFSTHVRAIAIGHKLLIAEVRFKLKSAKQTGTSPTTRCSQPSQQQLASFNSTRSVSAHFSQQGFCAPGQADFREIKNIIRSQAESSFTARPARQKKDYNSADTWRLLESKWSAIAAGDTDTADSLSVEIKRQVKIDREMHLLAQLEEITTEGYRWEGLKKLRAKFTFSFTKLKIRRGGMCPSRRSQQTNKTTFTFTKWLVPHSRLTLYNGRA